MILISILFLVPIYYTSISKGYNGKMFAIIAGIPSIIAMVVSSAYPHKILDIVYLVFPACMLGIVWILKPKPGAPGKGYLKITFGCPECGESITFPRHRAGAGVLCPECGEVVHVPDDEKTSSVEAQKKIKPKVSNGEVCFNTFGRPEPAHQWVAILQDNGVPARLASDSAGGALPHIGNTEGHRIMIDISHWDDAVEIEKQCQQETGGNASRPTA